MSHRRRNIVIVAALGAFVTLAAGIILKGNLQLRYYEYRLRVDPSLLLTLIAEPAASPAHVAASRFLEERRGREVLLRAYATHLAEEIDHEESDAHRTFASFGGGRVWFDASYSGRKLEPGESFCDEHEVVGAIRKFLPRLEGEVFQMAEGDDYEYSVLTSEDAVRLYRRSIPDREVGSVFAYRGSDAYVFRVRRNQESGTRDQGSGKNP